LRVLEDISRFYFDDEKKAKKIRAMKHKLRKLFDDNTLIQYRSVETDVGVAVSKQSRIDQKHSVKQVIIANCKRCQEGLRTLEEGLKAVSYYKEAKACEDIRYFAYQLESSMIRESFPREDIYYILGEAFSKGRSNIVVAREILQAGGRIIQYREKDKSKQAQLEECIILADLVHEYGGLFIVNDHLDIAMMCGADGIHLGQEDLPAEKVKVMAPHLFVGLSTHNMKQVKEALLKGVDYIGVGPMYETQTKDNIEASEGLKFLEEVSAHVDIPYVAIGGINKSNIHEVGNLGASCAMISAVVGADDIKNEIKLLKEKMND
jgi:thiamine-phosphate pyrophosphorylase